MTLSGGERDVGRELYSVVERQYVGVHSGEVDIRGQIGYFVSFASMDAWEFPKIISEGGFYENFPGFGRVGLDHDLDSAVEYVLLGFDVRESVCLVLSSDLISWRHQFGDFHGELVISRDGGFLLF